MRTPGEMKEKKRLLRRANDAHEVLWWLRAAKGNGMRGEHLLGYQRTQEEEREKTERAAATGWSSMIAKSTPKEGSLCCCCCCCKEIKRNEWLALQPTAHYLATLEPEP